MKRAREIALARMESTDSSLISDDKLKETILDAIDRPEFAWRKYFQWPTDGVFRLFFYPNPTQLDEQSTSFFSEAAKLVLAELEKPDKEREHGKVKTGIILIDREVNLAQVFAQDDGAARMVLEKYDVQFKAMTDSMWTDLSGYLREFRTALEPKPPRRPQKLRHKSLADGEKAIRRVIREEPRLKGLHYCRHLDDKGIKPRDEWLDKGCPPTYVEAYQDAYWRKQLYKEKSRVDSRMKKEKPAGQK